MTKEEFEKVKILGEEIGYGNMMEIASCLWRKKLGKLKDGAFVPTILSFIKKPYQKMSIESQRVYDSWYKKYFKSL